MHKLSEKDNQRTKPLWRPYGRQSIDEEDIAAVVNVLRSDWLTTGPEIPAFEEEFAKAVGACYAVAVNNGTAALHTAMHAAGVGSGDEVLVPTLTFAASANCVVYQGGSPVFVDVDPGTLLIDLDDARAKITNKPRAIVAVDYAGQPCDYDKLNELADEYNLVLIADACHSLGGRYHGKPAGSLARLNTFSLHPVKPITSGEGGMITTDDADLAEQMRQFRNHGITTDHVQRKNSGACYYDMVSLGYNYRLTDMQAALGRSQLNKLAEWTRRRNEVAARYDNSLSSEKRLSRLITKSDILHAYHLYVIKAESSEMRDYLFKAMREEQIGVTVHYRPVHLHPYYRERFGTGEGLCPVTEDAASRILSLPIYPKMTDQDVNDIVSILARCTDKYVESKLAVS